MTSLLRAEQRDHDAARAPASTMSLNGVIDSALDHMVVALATWTVVYHVCVTMRLSVSWAIALEAIALVVWAIVAVRRGRRRGEDVAVVDDAPLIGADTAERALVLTTGAAAVVAATGMAVPLRWEVVVAAWLLAALSGTLWASLRLRRISATATDEQATTSAIAPDRVRGALLALAWAVGLAYLAAVVSRPNPDDVLYINVAQWVVERGAFPVRDTLFSDELFAPSNWPPVASFEALIGTIARIVGVSAGSVTYLIVPPVATFLSVLTMWRLLRQWRVRYAAVALSIALVFLLYDGSSGTLGAFAPGNLFLVRIWQGKIVFAAMLLPLLLVFGLRYAERPSRGRAGWLFAGGVAAVGLTTSAIFIVPLLALGAMAPVLVRSWRRGAAGLAALSAYPLGAGVVTLVLDGYSPDTFEGNPQRFDAEWFGHNVFRDGTYAFIAVLAVLLGAVLVRHRAGRVTTGVLVGLTGVTYVPGVTDLSFDLIGLGPTLWRVSWLCTVALLVGVAAVRVVELTPTVWLRVGVVGLMAAVLYVSGTPLWDPSNGAELQGWTWKRRPPTLAYTRMALELAEPGDTVLAPTGMSITLTTMTTRVKPVVPRRYLNYRREGEAGFNYDEREVLARLVEPKALKPTRREVIDALDTLQVDVVCLAATRVRNIGWVTDAGYDRAASNNALQCLTR